MAQPDSSQRGTSFDVQVLILAILFALVLQTGAVFTGASIAQAARLSYNCTVHCYATSEWDSTSYHGGETDINMVHLSCTPSSCYSSNPKMLYFIDDEMWLYGAYNHDGFSYHVEAGYSTFTSSRTNTHEDYFWAENRPTYGYDETDLGSVPSGDYGYYTQFQVYQEGNTQSYYVAIYTQTTSYAGGNGSNKMAPDAVTIGQELSGTSGASALDATFIDNGYFDANGATHYYTTEGMPTNDDPPYSNWAIIPNSTNHGGEFLTYCC